MQRTAKKSWNFTCSCLNYGALNAYMWDQIWALKWECVHKTHLKCCGLGHQGRVCCCGGWPCLLSCVACVCACTGIRHTPTTQNHTQPYFKAASKGVPAFPLDPVNRSQTLRRILHLSTGILLCGIISVQGFWHYHFRITVRHFEEIKKPFIGMAQPKHFVILSLLLTMLFKTCEDHF